LCLALLFFSPESQATSCPVGATATCVAGQGDWISTLQARSFDGGATIGGYFDTALNITWLADANRAQTSGVAADGHLTYSAANAWANTLDVNGITGWRLPTMTDTGSVGCDLSFAGGTDCGYNVQTGTSEMAHMFYVTLADKAYCPPGDGACVGGPQPGWGLTNTGPFANLQGSFYWTDLAYVSGAAYAWYFLFSDGSQFYDSQVDTVSLYAWAVHPGKVGDDLVEPVPIPAAVWLLLSGLTALAIVGSKRAPAASSTIRLSHQLR
jgi:hypothetical protein